MEWAGMAADLVLMGVYFFCSFTLGDGGPEERIYLVVVSNFLRVFGVNKRVGMALISF